MQFKWVLNIVDAIQMSTHNIYLYKENQKKKNAYVVGTHLNCIDNVEYSFELHRQVDAIQMSTHNICLYKEVDKKYTGCNLKTTEWEIAAVFLLSPLTGKVQGRSNTNQVLLIGILCFYHRSSVELNKFLTFLHIHMED